jgi:hypothetical protein
MPCPAFGEGGSSMPPPPIPKAPKKELFDEIPRDDFI